MDFTAKWITGPAKIDRDSEVAPYLFRKQVTLPANVKSAVLYATALGVYSIFADNHKNFRHLLCSWIHRIQPAAAIPGI